ncbi:DUF429 domain-containing protein [candidate division KSB1 bacterium]|nr:DUF429 domain-containing protein [candidate division KSB1 bacterium]
MTDISSFKVIGLDLAGVETRPTGFCLLEDHQVKTSLLGTDREILDTIDEGAGVISIDAPLSLPAGRCCLRDTCSCAGENHFRQCDLELRRMRIKFFPITLGPMRKLTERGLRLKQGLNERGFDVIETFPGAAQDLWGIPRQKNPEGLREGLRKFGLTGDIENEDLSCHELDAITCALVGDDYLKNRFIGIGDEGEGLIILPSTLKVKGK